MPWSYPNNVPSVAKNWEATAQRKCVAAANAVLKDGGSDEDAIFACIHAAGKSKKQEAEMPTDNQELAADEAAKNAQKARSRRYGISVREDGNVTKPSEWTNVSDSQFGDPVNFLYPCHDATHCVSAKGYFKQHSGKYNAKSRSVVRGRINRLCRKHGVDPISGDTENENEFDGQLVGEIFLADAELPEDDPHKGMVRIPAARSATFNHPWHGKIYLDEDLFHSFIDNWDTNVLGHDLAIDAAHRPNDGALAWVRDIQVEDGGLVFYAEPTSKGDGLLGDVYRYASLWYRDNFTDQETGIEYGPTLMGCAATNTPFVHRQEPISVVMSADGEEMPATNNFIFVYDNNTAAHEYEDPWWKSGSSTLTVSVKEEDSPAELPADEIDAGGQEVMSEEVVQEVEETQPQVPDPSTIQVGDHTFTADELERLLGRQLALEKELKEARVKELCEKALARGVPPVVVEAAKPVLMAAEMDAPATIELELPAGDAEEGSQTKKYNYFGAVAHMLDMVPGRLGEVTYSKGEAGKPPQKRQPEGLYDPAAYEDMSLEEAEELARKRREQLGIKTQAEAEL